MTDLIPEDPRLTWILALGVLVAFLLAFSVGANDVSNSFGTSVGSGVLTVTQACILATFFEVAGSSLLGYSVCNYFRSSMYDVSLYEESQQDLMIGSLGCLVGSALWNFIATKMKMPISGTHSVIGATLGFNLVLHGMDSIRWLNIGYVVASWFISPLLSGFISSVIYVIISKKVIAENEPLKNGLKALPLFYGATIFINIASLTIMGPDVFGLNKLQWYSGLAIALLGSAMTICYTAIAMVPRIRGRIMEEMITGVQPGSKKIPQLSLIGNISHLSEVPKISDGKQNPAFDPSEPDDQIKAIDDDTREIDPVQEETSVEKNVKPKIPQKPVNLQRQMAHDKGTIDDNTMEMESIGQQKETTTKLDQIDKEAGKPKTGGPKLLSGERIEVFRLFSSLQILTACFASFAHGTNDVSNAVAPLIPIWNIWETGKEDIKQTTPVWLLFFGGLGICAGLWAWGRAVMRTVGTGLTQLTPSKGFSIELGAATSVLMASKFGIPISTTHCKVGSLVILGLVSDRFCEKDNLTGLSKGTRRISRLWADGILSEDEQIGSGKVDWKLFGNIAITWIVTVPLAAIASAITTVILKALAPNLI